MNRRLFNILMTGAVAGLFAACQQEDIVPDTPDTPTEGYHLTFGGGVGIETDTRAVWNDDKGSGDLIFQWDYTPEGAENHEVVISIVNSNNKPVQTNVEGMYHTFASIHKHSDYPDDAHWATFKTIGKYPYDLFSGEYEGHYVLAVTPVCAANDAFTFNDVNRIETILPMPATFTQVADQKPDFLRNYMYMYADEQIVNNKATLRFRHIPVTFRFIINNKRPTEANIKSVTMSVDDGSPIASSKAGVSSDFGRWFSSSERHTAITTLLGENGTVVQKGDTYTAYALAFPVANDIAFKGKKIKFTIETDNPDNKYLSFVLDASQIKDANHTLLDNDVYDWYGGKSYTIRMSLNDILTFEGITVTGWNEQDPIDAGEAEDMTWKNGINKITGEYEVPQQNADGYYEIANAGNLFWFAQQVNEKGNREIKGILTEDIDLENRHWTPIGTTGETNNNFRGIFDGQNHTITGLYVDVDRAGVGFFGEVRTGTVKNFTINGEVVVNTEVNYVGGVIGSACGLNSTDHGLERNGAIIQNITSYVNLTAKAHGIGRIGGFIGYANHETLIENCSWYDTFDAGIYRVDDGAGGFIGHILKNTSKVTISDCAAYGTIKTNYAKGSYVATNVDSNTIYMGGFLSLCDSNTETTLKNCLFAGKFEKGSNLTDQAYLGAFGTVRTASSITNCYYYGYDGLGVVHSNSSYKPGNDGISITEVTAAELASGDITAKLGDAWEQRDNYPVIKR